MKVISIQNIIRWYINITSCDKIAILMQGLELPLPQGMFVSEDVTAFSLPVEDSERNNVYCVCVCMCAYMCVYICVCACMSVYVCICLWICVFAAVCMCVCVCVCVYVCVCMCVVTERTL